MRAYCAQAPCRAGLGRSTHNKRALHRREASLLPHAAAVQRASCGLQEPACFHVARATALLRSLPLGRRRSTRACCARALCCAARGQLMYCERALIRREASLLWRAAVMRHASCSLQELTGFRAARATAPLRSLHLGRRRSTRACCARAPCRASSGRIAHRERALHRREAILFRRTAAVRRASCGLRESTGFRVARATAPLRSLPLGRGRSTRGSCARAPCRTGSDRSTHNKRHCTGERPLSFHTRPRCNVPVAASKNTSLLSRGTRDRAIALAASRKEAQHAGLLRACVVLRCLGSAYIL